MYRMAPSDSTVAKEPGRLAIHYVVGSEITIRLNEEGEAEQMEVTGQTRGIHLEPVQRGDEPGDTLSPPDTLTPPDTSVAGNATMLPDTLFRFDTLFGPDPLSRPGTVSRPDTVARPDTLTAPDTWMIRSRRVVPFRREEWTGVLSRGGSSGI